MTEDRTVYGKILPWTVTLVRPVSDTNDGELVVASFTHLGDARNYVKHEDIFGGRVFDSLTGETMIRF